MGENRGAPKRAGWSVAIFLVVVFGSCGGLIYFLLAGHKHAGSVLRR